MWVEVDDSPLGSKIDPVGPVATDKLTNATTPQDQLSKTSTTMDTAMQELDETSQTSDLGTGYADLGGLGLSDGAMEIGTDLSGTDLSGTDLSEIGLSEIGLSETSGMNDTSITDFGMDAGSAGQAVGVMPTGFSF